MARLMLPVALVLSVVVAGSRAQGPAETPASREKIEAALKLTHAAAAEYEMRVGNDKPLDLQREPILKWSNPVAGDVHGNAVVWTRDGRPLVVGCLFNWFSSRNIMEHEFHSLAEDPVTAKFHGKEVWKTSEAGLRFTDVPKAPDPAANETQRFLQLKQLAKDFSGTWKVGKDSKDLELRLLPQPLHRYAVPKQGIVTGGLFALVRATDPEIFLLIEARGKDAASARWQYAATRMHSMAEVRLRHQDKPVWESQPLEWKEVFDKHERAYTAFRFKEVPDFLRDAFPMRKP